MSIDRLSMQLDPSGYTDASGWPDAHRARLNTDDPLLIEIDKLSVSCDSVVHRNEQSDVRGGHALSDKYVMANPEVLRLLMRRTGDGRAVSIRALAKAAGVHHSTIGNLLTGEQATVSSDVAKAIAERIGVDLLLLWERDGRAVRSRRQGATA
ncbi:helix-turn-helix domain-containing protein [Streptomyces sp. NPDC051569]|uniref:helix-turn-helix domain-containing protein n=1 Tax=Streptomyces sp. NPDC051569 TaxID=3365661 RepID=UPI0037B93919